MKFLSTRNRNVQIESKQAMLQGLSDEGGLFVPETFPALGNLSELAELDYVDLSFHILQKFLTDFTDEELRYCVKNAYTDKFPHPICPIRKVGTDLFVELHRGRTSAFKDMALSILPYFLEVSIRSSDIQNLLILTATSGDTGKAALEGFYNVDNVYIGVFYPENGVSTIQKRQMQTQVGDNVFVLGVNGNFDDCQTAVKNIFTNDDIKHLLADKKAMFSSANSINIGRLLPQIIYYVSSYLTLIKNGEIQEGDTVNITVPTGNFGNILAGYYAKQMGLPIGQLICASNENHILTDFINTGIYDANRDLILTTSPSMDILISSNLERYLYHILDENTQRLCQLMEDLRQTGKFALTEEERQKIQDLHGYYCTEQESKDCILNTYVENYYLIDPHTAIARNCYHKYRKETLDEKHSLIMSTASPYKFPDAILDAFQADAEEDPFEKLNHIYDITNLEIPRNLKNLKDKKIRFERYVPKSELSGAVKEFIEEHL